MTTFVEMLVELFSSFVLKFLVIFAIVLFNLQKSREGRVSWLFVGFFLAVVRTAPRKTRKANSEAMDGCLLRWYRYN